MSLYQKDVLMPRVRTFLHYAGKETKSFKRDFKKVLKKLEKDGFEPTFGLVTVHMMMAAE